MIPNFKDLLPQFPWEGPPIPRIMSNRPLNPREIERYHGIIVAVKGHKTKSPSLPDWDISYVEYPPNEMKEYRNILTKAHVRIVKVTDSRIYFEQW